MALRQYDVTLKGTTTPVQATLTGSATSGHQPFRYMRIESDASNAIAYYGNSAVTTSSYAGTVIANTATQNNAVIIGPFNVLPSNVDEFWFLGTNNQVLRLTVIT